MSVTPLDVKKQVFDKVFRGYDPIAVDAFLELASDEMGALIGKISVLEERLGGLNDTVNDYRQMEQALKDTMLNAQKIAEDARDAAQRDADLVKREARVEADQTVAEAERRRVALERRIEDLENREREFVRKMRGFLDEHRRALEAHGDDATSTSTSRLESDNGSGSGISEEAHDGSA